MEDSGEGLDDRNVRGREGGEEAPVEAEDRLDEQKQDTELSGVMKPATSTR